MRGRKKYIWVIGIAAVVGAGVLWGCMGHYAVAGKKPADLQGVVSLENGRNLAFNICGQCHYDPKLGRFSGLRMHDLPRFMGKVYAANLTHSVSHGVMSRYSDAEMVYLLRTGISQDGRYIPYMIRPNLGDEDVKDILAYLRSKAFPVSAADTVPGKTHVNAFGKFATRLAGKPLPYNKDVKRPDKKDSIVYGRYLVDNLACYHCHSQSILGLNYLVPESSKGYMAGGMRFKVKGRKVHASNLTPEKETGLGKYDRLSFRKALKEGIKPHGEKMRLPMQQFPHLTDAQCDAIFYYLRTIAPKWNKVRGQ